MVGLVVWLVGWVEHIKLQTSCGCRSKFFMMFHKFTTMLVQKVFSCLESNVFVATLFLWPTSRRSARIHLRPGSEDADTQKSHIIELKHKADFGFSHSLSIYIEGDRQIVVLNYELSEKGRTKQEEAESALAYL